ncbi:S8 family serine peptidase [Micromonospora sp. KLBMP9576]|uniref:S8 family serine peptidase n=1 Tax=Micromonospora sp. KLBMP9576 TaxID=3424769 RepID=UPI003D8C31A6
MFGITRSARGAYLAVCVMMALIVGAAAPASAADEYVKFYAVGSSYQGEPENLTSIAARFLNDGARSVEIRNLNTGRRQPDGGILRDPDRLRAGWLLVLPWDAVGEGVRYGVLPDKAPATPVEPKPDRPRATPTAKAPPTVSPARVAGAATVPSKALAPRRAKGGQCATRAASSSRSDWASLRLAADQAWPQSRGKGQLVAIIDSGVDGSLPALSGHVAVGMDIVSGSGRGDTDCLGSGTAMAALVVGQSTKGDGVKGVAPEATVMPVRVVGNDAKVQPADGAAAIEATVEAGATVIALGNFVDTTKPEVAKAIMAAVDRDVVVVVGASRASVPVNPDAAIGPGVLRVGGVAVDGQRAADYRGGGIDVVAPGVNVNSVGITGVGAVAGSGTQYAVAFVAGTVALVRAAYPDLNPEQVARRLQVTSDKMGDGAQPDGRYGWGMISPATAVTKVLPEEAEAASSGREPDGKVTSGGSGGRSTLLAIVALVALAAAVLLVFRIRRLLRDETGDDEDDGDDDAPRPVTAAPTGRSGTLPPASVPRAPSVSRQAGGDPPPPDGGKPDPDDEQADSPASVVSAEPGTRGETVALPKASIGARSPQQRPDAS